MKVDKNFLLNESKVFCMFPWLHLNVTPKGDIYPCCSNNYSDPIDNTNNSTLEQAINHPRMKELRLNMLNEKKSSICEFCYKHEEAGPHSFRNYSKDNFSKYYDELVPNTQADGSIDEFKMRYFDIRFSNICNFKCRTCGSEFSSQWAKENRRYDKTMPILWQAGHGKKEFLDEILSHIDHIDLAYFAGGEPLITEEHYIMLEEMIRKKRTNIILRYNTNASNLKFKDYDILDLWKHFDQIQLSCSIDHVKERAEWIRHGTDWGEVETNLKIFRNLDYVDFQLNTVLSIFNYCTLPEFYTYLLEQDICRETDWFHSLYLAVHPSYYSAKSVPLKLKQRAGKSIRDFAEICEGTLYHRLATDAVKFAEESNIWNQSKDTFWMHTKSIDKIRNEDFAKTFPELIELTDLED